MKKTAFVLLPICLAAALSHAATLIDNTFNSVTTGAYNGTTGQEYGAVAELGNATANRSVNTVNASGGVGDSQYLSGQNPAIRSRSTVDIATVGTVSFSAYFKFAPASTTTTGGILGLGWALPAGADAANPVLLGENRLLIGVRRRTSDTNAVLFSASGVIPNTNISGSPEVNLTSGNWYQISFDLTFNYDSTTPADSTYTVANLSLKDWGTDGLTGGGVVMSMASATISPNTFAFASNLDTTHNAYAFLVTSSSNLGGGIVDNVLVASGSTPPPLVVPVGVAVALSGADVQVSFKSETGLNYQLWKSPGDLSSWAIVPGVSTTGDGTVKTLTDPAGAPAADGKVFYRVEVTN